MAGNVYFLTRFTFQNLDIEYALAGNEKNTEN